MFSCEMAGFFSKGFDGFEESVDHDGGLKWWNIAYTKPDIHFLKTLKYLFFSA